MTRQDFVRPRQATHRLAVLHHGGKVWSGGVLYNSTPDSWVSHFVDNLVSQ